MALFTDAQIVTLEDLLPLESSLVQVASSHGINVDHKAALAIGAVGEKLLLWLRDACLADPQWLSRRTLGLSTAVVTPPLKRWLCNETLSRFFAEAYNGQLNTRFQAKWQEYQDDAKYAADQFLQAGLGIVFRPLPKPQLPLVSIQQGVAPAGSLFVQCAWADDHGNEGALSPINGVVVGNQSAISVQMAEGSTSAPPSALGWNVYVGSDASRLTRQNGNLLTIGSTWSLPASGIEDGPLGGYGQSPDFIVSLSRQLRRG